MEDEIGLTEEERGYVRTLILSGYKEDFVEAIIVSSRPSAEAEGAEA